MSLVLSQYGDTPLHIAVRYGHEDMTQTLIAAGVNVSDQNNVSSESGNGLLGWGW